MKELLTVDRTYGDANCAWCEAPFVKTSVNRLYCSDECAEEKRASVRRYIPKQEVIETQTSYQDYNDKAEVLIDKYGVTVHEIKDRKPGTKYKIPEIKYKRFKESKNVFVFGQKREKQRSEWV